MEPYLNHPGLPIYLGVTKQSAQRICPWKTPTTALYFNLQTKHAADVPQFSMFSSEIWRRNPCLLYLQCWHRCCVSKPLANLIKHITVGNKGNKSEGDQKGEQIKQKHTTFEGKVLLTQQHSFPQGAWALLKKTSVCHSHNTKYENRV